MSLALLSLSALVVLSNFMLENVEGQDSSTVFQALQTLTKAVERLEAKIQLQASSMNNIEAMVKTQTSSLSSVEDLLNDLKDESNVQKTLLNNLANTREVQGNLLTKLEVKAAEQASSFSNLQAQSNEQGILLQKLDARADMQEVSLSNLVAEVEWHEPIAKFKTNRTIFALQGNDVEIWCVVCGTPSPDITWTRENGALASDRVVVENNGKSLRIKNARVSDEGTYDCVAANGVGTPATQSVRLHVYGHAGQCQGMIESDKGSIEIEPSSASRLCIIKLQYMNSFRIELDPLVSEPIVVIPQQSPSGSNAQFIQ